MILDSFYLPSLINKQCDTLGMDSLELCMDNKWWRQYPYAVHYSFNERGFRDKPWPQNVSDTVWCIGDSFTVGLGSPLEHTWPWLLSNRFASQKVINVSMNGASNMWIARKVRELVTEVKPKLLVVLWSFINRRELAWNDKTFEVLNDQLWCDFYQKICDPSWPQCNTLKEINNLPQHIRLEIATEHYSPFLDQWINSDGSLRDMPLLDEQRAQHYTLQYSDSDYENTIEQIASVENICQQQSIALIQGFIPNFSSREYLQDILNSVQSPCWGMTPKIDLARDGHHFDKVTAQWIVDQIAKMVGHAID